jgi:predicted ATPase/class 3 adenylate cyclase
MPGISTGTVTILFTDIEGSTHLWEQFPHAMQGALARHDALLRQAVQAHNGHVIKSTGDGLHAMFEAAGDAVLAVIAAQRALQTEPWGEIGPFWVRMGLHTGEVVQREGDYFAPAMNRAARLMAAGHGGQILLSAATYELVRDHLPAGVIIRDLGEHRLKDLIRSERIFQLGAADLRVSFPSLNTLDSRPNNLPAQSTSFFARERALAALRALLDRPDVRLLTLTGPGGIGKTRLSVQLAAELLDTYAHGAFFVPLAALSDPMLVASAIAQVLGLREAGDRPLQETLLSYLRDKELLLILDNFEQVVSAAPLVGALVAGAPQLKVVVTSRRVLDLSGEQQFAVPPLTVPEPQRVVSLDVLTQYEAVALFIQRAQLAKPDFVVTNDNAPAVAEICARLDGLPLAIELAAARIKVLPPAALLARLEHRLPLLTGGARDSPVRQQTMRSAIAWSYDLLHEREKVLFRRLSVFVGGCTLRAVEAVCDAQGTLGPDVLDSISTLVDESLLRLQAGLSIEQEGSGEPRFGMLDTIREYALERLAESGEGDTIRQHHAAYYLGMVDEADAQLRGVERQLWLDRLEVEHDNLQAALGWSETEARDTEAGSRLVGALSWFWFLRGYLKPGARWLEDALSWNYELLSSTLANSRGVT